MTTQKTWAIVEFRHGKAMIEASLNYQTKTYSLSHGCNDNNVTFKDADIQVSLDRSKCVQSALNYINNELFKN